MIFDLRGGHIIEAARVGSVAGVVSGVGVGVLFLAGGVLLGEAALGGVVVAVAKFVEVARGLHVRILLAVCHFYSPGVRRELTERQRQWLPSTRLLRVMMDTVASWQKTAVAALVNDLDYPGGRISH